jgi:hypothetical protein
MLDTVGRYMQGVNLDNQSGYLLMRIINPLADRMSSQPLTTAGLVINAGGAAFPKTGAADFYAIAQGVLVKVTAGTALPALTGITAPAGGFNVACYFVDSAGTLTVAGGTPAATLGGVRWPQFPQGKAMVGALIITNAGAFVGGTTALDGGTTIYVSPTGPFDPTVLL